MRIVPLVGRNKLGVFEAWVNPDFRRQGIYTRLWGMAVDHARELGIPLIEGATTSPYVAHLMEKQGRRLHTRIYHFEVNQDGR